MIDVPQHRHKPERGRLTALGRSTDDGGRSTLLVVHEMDGSWTIHGLGAPGVQLSAADMVALAESILGRPVTGLHWVYLVPAERQLLAECHRRRQYLALCGALLPTAELASSKCEQGAVVQRPGEGDDPAYCTACVGAAADWNATRAADRGEAPGRFGQRGRYFVGEYGHPARIGEDLVRGSVPPLRRRRHLILCWPPVERWAPLPAPGRPQSSAAAASGAVLRALATVRSSNALRNPKALAPLVALRAL